MVMGVIILKKKYTLDKFISVGMITAGISICTIVSSKDVVSDFMLIQLYFILFKLFILSKSIINIYRKKLLYMVLCKTHLNWKTSFGGA